VKHVRLYKDSKSDYWYVDIPADLSPTGKRLRRSTKTKNRRLAERIRGQVEEGRLESLLGARSVAPYKEFKRQYIEYVRAHFSDRTYDLYSEIVPRVLKACSWPPTPDELRSYWQGRLGGDDPVKPITVNKERRAVHAALQWGVEEKMLTDNPCSRVPEWPVENPASVEWFTTEELGKILTRLPKRYVPLVRWALATGMRLSECLNLRWSDIGEAKVRVVGKGRKVRHLPVTDLMQEILDGIDRSEIGPFPFTRSAVGMAFRRARGDAGIEKGHFHALRDTCARNLLVESRASIYEVAKILGHSSVQVTEKYYGHLVPEDLRRSMDELDAVDGRILSEKVKEEAKKEGPASA